MWGGVFIGLFVFYQSLQNSIVYEMDPRLSDAYLREIGLTQNKIREAGLIPQLTSDWFPFEKPRLSLGFDKPLSPYRHGTVKQNYYHFVAAFQNPLPSLGRNQAGAFKIPKQIKVFTADPLVYARYKEEISGLHLIESVAEVDKKIFVDENSIAILPVNDLKLAHRTLTPQFPIRLWMGWKENTSPFLSGIGINQKLNFKVSEIFASAERTPFPKIIKLIAVGDIMLGRRIGKNIKGKFKKDSGYPFTKTKNYLMNADITVGNLECTISTRGKPMPGKGYTFRAHPDVVSRIKDSGFDLMVLSNNHSKDYGDAALIDTLGHLKEAGIERVGAGLNYRDSIKPTFMTLKDGTKVGHLTYSMVVPKGFLPGRNKPGINWVRERTFSKEIKKAKQLCDILVVQFHWGKEYKMQPLPVQKKYGRLAIDQGADLVIGHHPHWSQTVEFYKEGFIAYSLGNFVFDMTHRPKVTEGMILTAKFKDNKLFQVSLDPVHLVHGQPEIIPPGAARKNRIGQMAHFGSIL